MIGKVLAEIVGRNSDASAETSADADAYSAAG